MKRLFRNPIGAMLWKELRENVVWAVLGALLLLTVNYTVLFSYIGTMNVRGGAPFSTVYDWSYIGPEAVITVGVTAVLATVLGFMQIFPELRRDQHAFLLHRPISYSAVFWCKATAGLLLYFVTTGGMLLLLWYLLWLTLRRHIPFLPFDWNFLLGGWANILSGVPFYFVAMLCAVRPARWYGSRILPLAGCIPLTILNTLRPEFYLCLWPTIILSVVMAWAACSSFAGLGHYRAQNRSGKLALGLSLLPGVLAMGTLALLMLRVWAEFQFPYQHNSAQTQNESQISSDRYGVTGNGEVVRIQSNDPTSLGKIVNWDGRDIKADRKQVREFYGQGSHTNFWTFRHPSRYFSGLASYRPNASGGSPYYTYYLYSMVNRRIYVTGLSGNDADILTPQGYYTAGTRLPEGTGFSGRLITMIPNDILWFSDAMYMIKPNTRTLKRIRSGSDVDSVDAHAVYERSKIKKSAESSRSRLAQYIAVVIAHSSIEFYDREGRKLFAVPREHDRHYYSTVHAQINRSGNRYYILYTPNADIPEVKRRNMSYYLVTLDKTGKIIGRRTLTALPRPEGLAVVISKRFRMDNLSNNNFDNANISLEGPTSRYINLSQREIYGLGMSLPLVGMIGVCVLRLQGVFAYDVSPSLWLEQLTLNFPEFWTLFVLALTSTFISCFVLWLLRRRSGLSQSSLLRWLTTVFLLGPAGLLLFLAMRGWPSRVECPSCGKQRAVDFDHCENCGVPWPQRPKDSADIFPAAPTTNS